MRGRGDKEGLIYKKVPRRVTYPVVVATELLLLLLLLLADEAPAALEYCDEDDCWTGDDKVAVAAEEEKEDEPEAEADNGGNKFSKLTSLISRCTRSLICSVTISFTCVCSRCSSSFILRYKK